MAGHKGRGEPRSTEGSVGPGKQRPWERVTARDPQDSQMRTTFRVDGPSPSQEILAKHDADLVEEPEPADEPSIICF